MIERFLNKRYSTRSLSDDEFESIVKDLALELSSVSFYLEYDDNKLRKDWEKLTQFDTDLNTINSTSRIGMKLCDHFFQNFYEIQDKNGKSFSLLWNDVDLLEKILRWNRKSHSTPYLSELKRGVYFCGGLSKATMYRPQMAKMITKNSKRVLDPCAGWGGRMLGSVANGAEYVAFEPNTKTYNNLINLINFLGISDKATIINDSALSMKKYNLREFDTCLTSPPYYNLEIYCDETSQSITGFNTYEDWDKHFLSPLITLCAGHLNENGISCWNVAKVGKNDMWDSVDRAHEKLGFSRSKEFNVVSSKRQAIQNQTKNKKSFDTTVSYAKL